MSNKLKQNAKDFYSEVKSNLTEDEIFQEELRQFRKFKKMEKKYSDESGSDGDVEMKKNHNESLQKMENHIHGDEHEAEFRKRMKHHGENGEFQKAYEEYSKFHGFGEDTSNEVKQVAMAVPVENKEDENIKEHEKKTHELSAEKHEKLKQISALLKDLNI